MHNTGVRSIAVTLVLMMLFSFSVVEGGGIWGGFFKFAGKAVRKPAVREGGQYAAQQAFSTWVTSQAPESNSEATPAQTNQQEGLTTADLNSLKELVETIRSHETESDEFCNNTLDAANQNRSDVTDLLSCNFILCTQLDKYREATSVGQDCYLELLVFNIDLYRANYSDIFCSSTGSSDCNFYECVTTELDKNADPDNFKSVGTGCYASTYSRSRTGNGSSASPGPSTSSSSSGAAAAVTLSSSALTSAFGFCTTFVLMLMV